MADEFTSSYQLIKPEPGGSANSWGEKLNGNLDDLDALIRQFVGMISAFPSDASIDGWLKCAGQSVSRTDYARLWDFVQASGKLASSEAGKMAGEFGPGNGSTTFSLPDLRGYHLRWHDDGAGVDPGRVLGSPQDDQNRDHDHGGATQSAGAHGHTATVSGDGSHSHSGTTGQDGSHSHSISDAVWNNENNGTQATNDGGDIFVGGTHFTGASGNHSHDFNITDSGDHSHNVSISSASDHSHGIASDGGDEVRVKNIALTPYIKY